MFKILNKFVCKSSSVIMFPNNKQVKLKYSNIFPIITKETDTVDMIVSEIPYKHNKSKIIKTYLKVPAKEMMSILCQVKNS